MHSVFMGERGEMPPQGFQSVRVRLPLAVTSSLQWKEEIKWAFACVQAGFSLVWDLEMNLFQTPFQDEAHLLSLQLALEHFQQEVLASFTAQTTGIILYKGALGGQFEWEYLKLLLAPLPEHLDVFLLLESVSEGDLPELLQVEHFHYAIKEGITREYPYALPAYGWEHGNSPLGFFSKTLFPPVPAEPVKVGVLDLHYDWKSLKVPFRFVSEECLTTQWDGLDSLVVSPHLSPQGRRKVAGFVAAGGHLLSQ